MSHATYHGKTRCGCGIYDHTYESGDFEITIDQYPFHAATLQLVEAAKRVLSQALVDGEKGYCVVCFNEDPDQCTADCGKVQLRQAVAAAESKKDTVENTNAGTIEGT